ncbi:MAG TPA: hypothetical protein VHT75_03000 [Acidimicrobiales bacterium]|nr:hypothetical protein [Acidimicrobiales bacterium]
MAALTLEILGTLPGDRLQDRWQAFETQVWPEWLAGQGRLPVGYRWT